MKLVKGGFFDTNKTAFSKKILHPKQPKIGYSPDRGVSYSSMLLDLIDPYFEMQYHDLEETLELGLLGWNMAVSKATEFPGFNQLFDTTIKSVGINNKQKEIVKKIMKEKQEKYSEYTNFIENYELSEDKDGTLKVTVTSKPFQDFMNDLVMGDNELDALQYEEGYVNRHALQVRPKPAFWNWLKKNDPEFSAPESPLQYGIYLMHEKDSERETGKWLKKNFDKIFINELESWIVNEEYWPTKRSYQLFLDFFELEYHSMILDLEQEPLIKE